MLYPSPWYYKMFARNRDRSSYYEISRSTWSTWSIYGRINFSKFPGINKLVTFLKTDSIKEFFRYFNSTFSVFSNLSKCLLLSLPIFQKFRGENSAQEKQTEKTWQKNAEPKYSSWLFLGIVIFIRICQYYPIFLSL